MTRLALIALSIVAGSVPVKSAPPDNAKPNLVFIIADDLGWGDVGCYGQQKIRTPNIDRLAADGMRFTRFYSGSPVCAPSRCVLMTGLHTGHSAVRNNVEVKPEGQHPLPAGTATIASLLKAAGYTTGAVGKWGLGGPGTTGDPNQVGFDLFFGYNCQRHAHNHYPSYLWKNDTKITLDGNNDGDTGKQFSHDLMEAEALGFIRANKARPFFLYLPFAVPHVALQVPDDALAEYAGKWEDPPYVGGKGYRPHKQPRACYAAMITRMDRSVGRIAALLKELGLDDRTLVVFTSDNGPTHGAGGADPDFFRSAGAFRGLKGSVYEGGLRVPFIARMPGRIKAGTTVDAAFTFADVLPTLTELAGAAAPAGLDGISILPTLFGTGAQKRPEHLYWEFASYGGQQAVQIGDWKGVRQNMTKGNLKVELYNLADDPGEKTDLAGKHPEIVAKMETLMRDGRTPNAAFPLKPLDK